MITMEKIDYVISVTGADYNRVREALLSTDGDVDKAIQMIMAGEKERFESFSSSDSSEEAKEDRKKFFGDDINSTINNFGEEVVEAVKEIWEKGNAIRLVVMDENDTVVLNVSMTIGAIWTVLAPLASLMGVGVGLLSKWEFYVYLDDGRAINIKDYIKNKHRMR